jgi:NAD(P)-dependent dehydrogenase (short-subunit alcohol dehydrogenase family)
VAPMKDLPRTAIVTGAARGIGAAVAKRLAREGHAIGVIDLKEADCAATVDAITNQGGSAIPVAADVADEAAVTNAIERVAAELGPPTVLVNNAGFARDADLAEMTTEQWDSVIGVHLRGSFFTTRAAQRYMVEAQWGRIINVSSISALGTAGRVNYSSAKAGVIGFTKALALELGAQGVTANVIAPGFIVSDMTAATARRLGRDFEEHQRIAARSIPVGRVGQPEDIAHAASFFASPDAGFVSGQVLYVAGGPLG